MSKCQLTKNIITDIKSAEQKKSGISHKREWTTPKRIETTTFGEYVMKKRYFHSLLVGLLSGYSPDGKRTVES